MTEIWKDIAGYENEYQVSNLGNVRSLDRRIKYSNGRTRFYKGQLIKPLAAQNGYDVVTLMRKHKGKKCLVHRLVALAFLNNSNGYPEVNHLDENKHNNCVSNLEWCTVKYNRNYGTRNERSVQSKDFRKIGEKNKVKQGKRVVQMNMDGTFVNEFLSLRDAERITGFARQAISACCHDKCRQAYGFLWAFTLPRDDEIL